MRADHFSVRVRSCLNESPSEKEGKSVVWLTAVREIEVPQ